MNFGGKSKPKGTLAFMVIRANPQSHPFHRLIQYDRLVQALKGILKWQ